MRSSYKFLTWKCPATPVTCRPDLLMSGNCRILSVVVLHLGLALALTAGAAAESTPPPLNSDGSARAATPAEYGIVRALNAVRAANGLPPLRVGIRLTRAARAHSVDMARRGYFEHGAFVQRLRRFGVRAPYVGENLAYGNGGLSAAAVVQMWLTSPPHRQNMLDRSFRRIGVGIAGSSRRLVTADFSGGY
jgi:uncharacterized protein YkwD